MAALLTLTSTALVACGTAVGEPAAVPVPTFAASAESAAAGAPGAPPEGRLPDDCARVLAVNDLGALFGLPLETVAVKTVLGAPSPSVGRVERLACRYSRAGGADGLLDINVGAYTDPEAAARQWRTNLDAEDGTRTDVALGAAQGVLVERPQEAVLMVVNGSETLTFVLPQRVRIRDLSAGDTLVDLALRVLPAVSRTAPPAPVPSAVREPVQP